VKFELKLHNNTIDQLPEDLPKNEQVAETMSPKFENRTNDPFSAENREIAPKIQNYFISLPKL
jgi:hypothetical protein